MGTVLYIFSGLGADERVFQFLEFPGYEVKFIEWIVPDKNEAIEDYAFRLTTQITTFNPILIGLSFGGMIAVEVAKQIETEKVILIASAKIRAELPFYYKVAGKLGLHNLIPVGLLKSANPITNWFFGAHSSFDKKLLKQILTDTDPVFLKWAIDKIVHWENKEQVYNMVHIHGSADRILPLRYLCCKEVIEGGGHLMTLNKGKELTEVLQRQLSLTNKHYVMESTPFKRLIGSWKTEGIIFDGEANTKLSGIDTYEWILKGQYILHKAKVMMGDEQSETFEIISAGKAETEAKMQYYNSKGESGVETATLAGNDYRIEAEGMRFEGVINDDNSRIRGKWTLRTADGDWKDYIELILVRQNTTA